MVIPLVGLALLSIVGGWIGIPAALKGADWFHHFLAPVFNTTAHSVTHHAAGDMGLIGLAHAAEAAVHGGHELVIEWALMGVSLGVAMVGIGLAYYFYLKKPEVPGIIAEQFKLIYRIIFNKYYIDEIYNAIFVQPIRRGSEWLWHSFDDGMVDATANGSGRLFIGLSTILKRLQTGYVQNYAVWMLVGTVLLMAYCLFR